MKTDSEGKMLVITPRTADGIEIEIGMQLFHRNGGPAGIVVAITDWGLCVTVESRFDRATWHASRTFSSLDAMLASKTSPQLEEFRARGKSL